MGTRSAEACGPARIWTWPNRQKFSFRLTTANGHVNRTWVCHGAENDPLNTPGDSERAPLSEKLFSHARLLSTAKALSLLLV